MNRFLVFLIYNLLLPVALAIGFPRFVIKGIRRGGLKRNFGQRLGCYRREIRERLGSRDGSIWIHAVSVGEVLVALKVIAAIGEREAGRPVVLSTTTTTGFAVAERESGKNVTVIHNPVDLPFVVGRAIRLIRPARLILVEAEVWPNLVRKVRARGVPVTLVNARLSERSERRFRRFAFLTRPIFQMLDRVCVPFDVDVARWEDLGVPSDRIELTGSVKFDEAATDVPDRQIAELSRWLEGHGIDAGSARILLAGSTHAGEEELIGRAWLRVRERFPEIIYIAIPRHAERARSAANDLVRAGISPILKVPIRGFEESEGDPRPRCFVANTTGELRAWHHLAEVVVIGKSLLGRGGQNPVEPLIAGKAVVAGPHMGNFSAIVASLLREKGILQAGRGELEETLSGLLEHLFDDSAEAVEMARRGRAVIERHRGAAARTVAVVFGSGGGENPPGKEA